MDKTIMALKIIQTIFNKFLFFINKLKNKYWTIITHLLKQKHRQKAEFLYGI